MQYIYIPLLVSVEIIRWCTIYDWINPTCPRKYHMFLQSDGDIKEQDISDYSHFQCNG